MSAINLLGNNQYYSLTGQQYGTNSANTTTGTNTVNALAQALNNPANNAGDVVDLSPEAQNYLSSLTSSANTMSGIGGLNSNFVLSASQRQKINDILLKYKDAPFTQDTYNQIQNDLQAAGLSPEQLAKEDKIKSFNPTQTLLDMISGKSTGITDSATTSDAAEKTKSDNYMQQILKQWANLSSTASSPNALDSLES